MSLERMLEEVEAGRLELAPLTLIYDDLHPFWGGVTLTIHGSGDVEQHAIRRAIGACKQVTKEELLGLVRLALSAEAWEQRVPDRVLVPDENRVLLKIRYLDQESVIWERHHELQTNQRIIQIRDAMFRAAGVNVP